MQRRIKQKLSLSNSATPPEDQRQPRSRDACQPSTFEAGPIATPPHAPSSRSKDSDKTAASVERFPHPVRSRATRSPAQFRHT
jgi:hypothetical protein